MDQPLISIIVPCYNQAQYLPEALDSVLAQTYPNWECVIVNDGSPDNTDEVACRYCDMDKRFKYLKQINSGVSMARNNGIKLSHGEYILPLDGDDMIAPTYCEKAIYHFLQFPETKLVYCKAEFFGDNKEPWNLPEYRYDEFIWSNCIFNSAFYKRVDYDKTIGYNPNMVKGGEDKDFWLSLIKKDDIIFQIDECLFFYRSHGVSRMSSSNNHLREVNRQVVLNHLNIFEPFFQDILFIYEENKKNSIRNSELEQEVVRLRNTKAYKLGKNILRPFSFLKRF